MSLCELFGIILPFRKAPWTLHGWANRFGELLEMCVECEGWSSSPLHSRFVRGDELNFKSSTPIFGSTTKSQHIRSAHQLICDRAYVQMTAYRSGADAGLERIGRGRCGSGLVLQAFRRFRAEVAIHRAIGVCLEVGRRVFFGRIRFTAFNTITIQDTPVGPQDH
jgi:hypothetical protein